VEDYALSSGLGMADALIAATAVEAGLPLLPANTRRYEVIQDLAVLRFRP